MGNGAGKISGCFTGTGEPRRRHDPSLYFSGLLDDGLGHCFCYVRPDTTEETTTFRVISGASISANTSTPLSTSVIDIESFNSNDRAASFKCSTSFTSTPLQPVPRNPFNSGPVERIPGSAPLFMSRPLDRGLFSGPLERSVSYAGYAFGPRRKRGSLIRVLKTGIRKMPRGRNMVAPIRPVKEPDWLAGSSKHNENLTIGGDGSLEDADVREGQKHVEWAHGKAGEDQVHVVISEERGWFFVGIYDGFNGPDAPDFLVSNLYLQIQKELKGLLWGEEYNSGNMTPRMSDPMAFNDNDFEENKTLEQENHPFASREWNSQLKSKQKSRNRRSRYRDAAKKWEEIQRKWKNEWEKERIELNRKLKEQLHRPKSNGSPAVNHGNVLKALSQALKKTEKAYLEMADKMLGETPELAMMGSCVLVMLMKGEDVYVTNVGDSRAVLAQKAEPDYLIGRQNLERINEEPAHDLEASHGMTPSLTSFQLSVDHSTSVEEEVRRIRDDHPGDASAVLNDRVKGSLKVTRAIGAGFLKQPKSNNALLGMFRVDYVGTSPYITCIPSLRHHRLGPRDKFIILSSDGLYQYFTNEEAVSEVELFITLQPDGDPAQHLVEEVLFRAAKKAGMIDTSKKSVLLVVSFDKKLNLVNTFREIAGMDFHELLEIPQGDRRRYHDDVSIIVVSLEGRMWRSCA